MAARGLPVTLLDAYGEGLSWEETAAFVRRLRPDVLGLSTMTPVRDVAWRAAALLRPYVRHIVLGGPHPTAVGSSALDECPDLDFLVEGEGEETLPALVEALSAASQPPPIPGVVSRSWHGGPGVMPDPERLPLPARHLLPNHRYRYPLATRAPIATLITSRGCPFHCTFCDQAVTGRRWRPRSPAHVLDELRHLEATGFRYVNIYDDNFTVDRRRVEAICEGILRQKIRLDWKCEARVDGVDREMLKLMARAGCRTIAYGLETANQVGMDALRKDSTVEEARQALRWTRKAGIETMAYVLFGIPGETPADARRTLEFCEAEGVSYVQFSTLSAVPGTALFDQAQAEGWITGADVRGPFDDDLSRATIIAPGWTEESLREVTRAAYRRFYLRPSFAVRHGVRAWRSGLLGSQVRDAADLVRRSLAMSGRGARDA
jgi:radical SAM superfamily enzyme YgiQ (UPF0313 family)